MGKKKKENKIVKGQEITRLWTLKSWYDNGYISANVAGHGEMRIHVSELIKMVNEFEFEAKKSCVYYHLINPKLIEE